MDTPTHLVTGGAGFIGRTVVDRLLADGTPVHLVDRADQPRMQAALRDLAAHPRADLLRVTRADLATADLAPLLTDAGVVVHLAGQPGVQASWGDGFGDHVRDNVLVTQRLLEATLDAPVDRVVVASSSSVLRGAPDGPVDEATTPSPVSPYGVTKATVEQLCATYASRGVPTVALRFFTVYGRHQRPDMAVARMLAALDGGPAFPLRGDGWQERDWTHVDDITAGVVAATRRDLAPGTVCNLGSGNPVSLREVLRLTGELAGRPVPVRPVAPVPGDPARTWADTRRAADLLGWEPLVPLRAGLADQLHGAGLLTTTSDAA